MLRQVAQKDDAPGHQNSIDRATCAITRPFQTSARTRIALPGLPQPTLG